MTIDIIKDIIVRALSKLKFFLIGIIFINSLLHAQNNTSILAIDLHVYPAICDNLGSAEIEFIQTCSGTPTISWSTGSTGLSISELNPGDYSVTISDGDDCEPIVKEFEIISDAEFKVDISVIGNTCNPPVVLKANTINAPANEVNFLWNTTPASSSQQVTVSDPNVYHVEATYGACTYRDSLEVVSGVFDFAGIVHSPHICSGSPASANINLGNQPPNYEFSYEWSTGDTVPGIIFHDPGEYCLTVTETSTGCISSKCFTIGIVPGVIAELVKNDISCHNKNDGTAEVIISGGTPDYQVTWQPTWEDTTFIENLSPGTYVAQVRDANNCFVNLSTTIINPLPFSYSIDAPEGVCYGNTDTVVAMPEGGTYPYSYLWDDGVTDSLRVITFEETTTYSLTVVDANSCEYDTDISAEVLVSLPISLNINTSDLACNGVCEGVAEVGITGGIEDFSFEWEYKTTDSIWETIENTEFGLCKGSYIVTVTDRFNCKANANFVINEPDTIIIYEFSGEPSCFGYTDGYAYVNVFGGVPFLDEDSIKYYNYNWSFTDENRDSVAIGAGHHYVTITDRNECENVIEFIINQPEDIYVSFASTPPGVIPEGQICIGQTYETTAHATGGTVGENSNYTFYWTGPGNYHHYGRTLSVSPDTTTTYTLLVTDDNNCKADEKFILVKVHPPLNIIGISLDENNICQGQSVTIDIAAEGGNGGPYIYKINDANVINIPYTFYPQTTGYYRFRVDDLCNSPYDRDSVYINVHSAPAISITANRVRGCPPAKIEFEETSSGMSYTYLWDFGDGTHSIQKNPVKTFTQSGWYDISLKAWSEYGCENEVVNNKMIRIYPKPNAIFDPIPKVTSIYDPAVRFRNHSQSADYFFWDFGDDSHPVVSGGDTAYVYSEIGEYIVKLIARNHYNCYDTTYNSVIVNSEFAFNVPNAFTPNGDGINDLFYIQGAEIERDDFYFAVYDRYGNLVHESTIYDANRPERMAWDGTLNGDVTKGDPVLPAGIYFWYCSFNDYRGRPHQRSGQITLLK